MKAIKINKVPNAMEEYLGMCMDVNDDLFYSFYSEKDDIYKMISIENEDNPKELSFSDYDDLKCFFEFNEFEMQEVRIVVG